jgi:hypothetical protein
MFKGKKKTLSKLSVRLILGFLLMVIWSMSWGWGIASALKSPQSSSSVKSVDPAVGKYQIGEELYLEHCSSCHIPIPPAVLPSQTWETILENPYDHYGTTVDSLIRLTQVLIWEYVGNYSRPLDQDEVKPNYIAQSRYFKALHPQVQLPNPVTHRSCVQCHPNAIKFDYRTLSPDLEVE